MREDGQRTCFTLGKTPGAERVLLWDDLEGLFKWGRVSGWGLPRLSKSATGAFDGSWGLQVLGVRRFPDGILYHGAGRSFPMVRDGILRAEAVAMIPSVGGIDGCGVALQWYDGTKKYEVRVAFETISNYFMWWDSGCHWADTGLSLLPRADDAWHRVWMEIDLVRKEYVNVGIDADTVQLDGNKICAVADAGSVVATVILFVVDGAAGTRPGYFDDVLVRTV